MVNRGIAELTIDGTRYGGWQRVSVTRSIEQMAGSFELEITERWPGQPQRTPIRPGQQCQLRLDGTPVITGWVDVVSPDYDAQQHRVRVAGRDLTSDLVDCSAIHKTGQWRNVKIDRIARDLIEPFGIELIVEAEVGAVFRSYNIQEGETVFECLERAARMRALLLTSDTEGRLVITRAGAGETAAALIEGQNIKAARAEFSWQDRFSDYTVKGHGRLGTWDDHSFAAPSAAIKDENITRRRPLILLAEAHGENTSMKVRAEWEMNVRRGRSCRGSITVQGWTRKDGSLWLPNTLVSVTSPLVWLGDAHMLISGCVYTLDGNSGTLTELTISRPDAFELLEGVGASKLFKKLRTKEQREKREDVLDWSSL